jgi:hypothetical protein
MSRAEDILLLPSSQETVIQAPRTLSPRGDLSPEELDKLVNRRAQAIIRAGHSSNRVVLLNDPETSRVVQADLTRLIQAAKRVADERKKLRNLKAGRKLLDAVLTDSDLDPEEIEHRLEAIFNLADGLREDAEKAR